MAAAVAAATPKMNATVAVLRQRGEEGAVGLVNAAGGDFRVQLFFQLVRDCPAARIRALVRAVLTDAEAQKSPQHVADLFLIAFQTRNCRGGKGEKRLFYLLVSELLAHYPQACLRLAALIPRYGYYKDLFGVAAVLQADLAAVPTGADNKTPLRLLQQWIELVVSLSVTTLSADAAQLRKVEAAEAAGEPLPEEEQPRADGAGRSDGTRKKTNGLTLLAKYFPNELTAKQRRRRKQAVEGTGPGGDGWGLSAARELATQPIKWFNLVAQRLFGDRAPRPQLRRLLTALRGRLNVTEALMSARRWDDIDVGRVASLCLMRSRKALQRHCAASMHRAVLQKRVNAVQLFPHEVAQKFLDNIDNVYLCEVLGEPVAPLLSAPEKALFELQWEKLRDDVRANMLRKKVEAEAEAAAAAGGGAAADADAEAGAGPPCKKSKLLPAVPLTNVIPVVDMSGSMHGTPVAVAVAFGILLAELAENDHFRGRVLTFAAEPEWFTIDDAVAASANANAASDTMGVGAAVGVGAPGRQVVPAPAAAAEASTLEQKIKAIKSIQDRCGETTNIGKAFDRVLAVAVEHQLPQAELPELVIFSDMQFTDAAGGTSWATEYEATRRRFAAAGYAELPLVTFWNLRAVEAGADGANGGDAGAVPAAASAPGVRLLSGYSPHLMQALLNGEFVEEEVPSDGEEEAAEEVPSDGEEEAAEETEEPPTAASAAAGDAASAAAGDAADSVVGDAGCVAVPGEGAGAEAEEAAAAAPALPRERRVNPLATLRKTLDDAAYDPVREVLAGVAEKLLQPVAGSTSGGGGGGGGGADAAKAVPAAGVQ